MKNNKNEEKPQLTAKQKEALKHRRYLSTMYYDNHDMLTIFKISSVTLWRWRRDNRIKYSMIAKKHFYPKVHVDRMMFIRNE